MSLEVAVLVALASLAALLFATLLVVNWWHRRRDARAARLLHALEPLPVVWAERDPSPAELAWLERLSPADGRTVLVASLEALAGLEPAGAERVRQVLRRSAPAEREIRRLRHRSAARRIEGCRFAGRLGGAGVVPLLVERLHDPDRGVRREAIRALGELRAWEAVADVAQAIEAMDEWTNLLLLMALVRMGQPAAPEIGALLETSRSPAMTKALLQVTSRLGVLEKHATVLALTTHADPEIRVEAVRVLGAIAPRADSFAACLAAMDDAEWPVRALAASSLGRLGDARAIPRLSRAMGDPAYWVRHHVSEAMAMLGESGAEALRRALHDANPFVRDMAAQTLFMRVLSEGEAA